MKWLVKYFQPNSWGKEGVSCLKCDEGYWAYEGSVWLGSSAIDPQQTKLYQDINAAYALVSQSNVSFWYRVEEYDQ